MVPRGRNAVTDLVYLIATIGFFAVMLLYVRACHRLGQSASDDRRPT